MADSDSVKQRLLLLKTETDATASGLLDTVTVISLLESDDFLIRFDSIRMFERLKISSDVIQNKIVAMLRTDDKDVVRLGIVSFIGRRYSYDDVKRILGGYTDSSDSVNRIIQTYLSPSI